MQDCTQDKDFAQFNPLVCTVYKHCGITSQTYHNVCKAFPSLQLVCCSLEPKIVKSSNGFQTLELGPDGRIEGVLYDTRYEEQE